MGEPLKLNVDLNSQAHRAAEKSRLEQLVNAEYLKGKPQAVIADELGISQPTVSRYLKRVADYCRKIYTAEFKELLLKELQKLDLLEMEAWGAWKKSCADAEKEVQKVKGVKGTIAPDLEQTKSKEGQSGDPRFLETVMKCIAKRCELLGVEAPKKHELSGSLAITKLSADELFLKMEELALKNKGFK